MTKPLRIISASHELQDGLFGNVVSYIFQTLPYLYKRGIFPAWQIRTSLYGEAPDYITVPGVFDLAYVPASGPYRDLSLLDLRRQRKHALGNDWNQLSHIWHSYFTVPPRIQEQAQNALPAGRILGLHYRGNDKLTTLDDSNPFTQEDFIALVQEFLEQNSRFDVIFAATDDFSFIAKLRGAVSLPVINLGEVAFHKAEVQSTSKREKADRALLDSLLLARCTCVVETSSALPSFAKVFNPELEIYRTAASKLFEEVPYFPVAFIPVLPVRSKNAAAILQRSLDGDWTFAPNMERFKRPLISIPRKPIQQALLRVAYSAGADTLVRRLVDYRIHRKRRTREQQF